MSRGAHQIRSGRCFFVQKYTGSTSVVLFTSPLPDIILGLIMGLVTCVFVLPTLPLMHSTAYLITCSLSGQRQHLSFNSRPWVSDDQVWKWFSWIIINRVNPLQCKCLSTKSLILLIKRVFFCVSAAVQTKCTYTFFKSRLAYSCSKPYPDKHFHIHLHNCKCKFVHSCCKWHPVILIKQCSAVFFAWFCDHAPEVDMNILN